MKKTYYMDRQTGEIMTYRQMLENGARDYDLDDPTNCLDYPEYYEQMEVEIDDSGMKWYNIELFNPYEIDRLRRYLAEREIKYESSGCENGVHFEVYMTSLECMEGENFLSTL